MSDRKGYICTIYGTHTHTDDDDNDDDDDDDDDDNDDDDDDDDTLIFYSIEKKREAKLIYSLLVSI